MPRKPVVWLHFATTPQLPGLVREEIEIRKTLIDLHDKGAIEVICNRQFNVEEIFHNISRYGDRIRIIHMARHTNSDYLQLNGEGPGTKARAMGIGKRFGKLDQLILVFLNGCNNLGQVERMLAAGVSGVIATSKNIGDRSASLFSTQFYSSLSKGMTVENAFREARTYLETLGNEKLQNRQINIFRDLTNHNKESSDFPWGLYLYPKRKEANKVLNWRVPTQPVRVGYRLGIGAITLIGLTLLVIGLLYLVPFNKNEQIKEFYLLHQNDTLSTDGLAMIGGYGIGFDRGPHFFSCNGQNVPDNLAVDFFQLVPSNYKIDSISLPQKGGNSYGLHVSSWVDSTIQIIRKSCPLRKELRTNWEVS